MPVMERKETLQTILCWTSETQVDYAPDGKRPGTASYERYEQYSKAKTVGEALALGSKPEDLEHDFSRHILKVTGGALREKPLEASGDTSTDTDRALIRFARSLKNLGQADLHPPEPSKALASPAKNTAGPTQPDEPVETAESAGAVTRLNKGKKVAKSTKALKVQNANKSQPNKELSATEPTEKQGRLATHSKCRGGFLARMAGHAKMAAGSRPGAAAAAPPAAAGPAASAIRSDSVIQGGLLARVMVKHGVSDLGEMNKAPPPVRSKPAKGPKGKFLSKVKLQRRTSDSGSKDPEAEADNKEVSTTPPKKKARKEPLVKSAEKEPTPRSRLVFPTPSATPEETKLDRLQPEPAHCCHLLALATMLNLSTKDPVAATSLLANLFQSIAQSTSQSEEVICAAIKILDLATPVPPPVLAAVVKQAFGAAAATGKDGDALAEAALESRRAAGNTQGSQRLLLADVARAAEERAPARLAGLLRASRAEAGETYWLIRLLQGRSGIARDTLHTAIARTLISAQ